MGYSRQEADDLKARIRTQVGKVEDAGHSLLGIVTDVDEGATVAPEAVEKFAAAGKLLEAIVDRRTD